MPLGVTEYSKSHESLDPRKSDMTELIVPSKKLLLVLRKVAIRVINSANSGVEGSDTLSNGVG